MVTLWHYDRLLLRNGPRYQISEHSPVDLNIYLLQPASYDTTAETRKNPHSLCISYILRLVNPTHPSDSAYGNHILGAYLMYSLFQPRDRQLGLAPAPLLLGRGRGRGRPALRLGGRGRQGGQGLLCQVSNKL